MSLFGDSPHEDDVSDPALIKALRKRLLDEIRTKREASQTQKLVNNIYGGSVLPGQGGESRLEGGLTDRLGGGSSEPDPRDLEYFVDIMRKPINPANPDEGWNKSVHRYAKKKVMGPTP